jgi:hypothetical protein
VNRILFRTSHRTTREDLAIVSADRGRVLYVQGDRMNWVGKRNSTRLQETLEQGLVSSRT